jgi:four helix bundle protein
MQDLILYQKIYDFLLYIYPIIGKYPKREKFALQERTKNCILDIQECIIKANKSNIKKNHLYEADSKLEELKTLIRLANDLHYINQHTYGVISTKISEIGSLLGGFIKYVQNK